MIFTTYLPLSLYIHIPWCIKKCPYCDFNSHEMRSPLAEQAYVTALLEDLVQDLPRINQRHLHSIFIGGGTPSLLSGAAYNHLLASIRSLICFEPNIEITIEANPSSADQQNFSAYREAGINRISLGIQSFQNDYLKKLGRVHDAQQAMQAITAAKDAGFNNFNLDLMFGLPGQKIANALADLTTAISFNPTHLSWYQLTLEPNTIFYKRAPLLPDEQELWEIEQQGQQYITQRYQQYEISAYSQAGFQSQHNLNYWLFGDYLGIGAGAHAKITNPDDGSITRLHKIRQPQDYLNPQKRFIAGEHQVSRHDMAFELMLNCLRLHQVIPWELITTRAFLSFSDLKPTLERAQDKGLISLSDYGFQTTLLGRRFLNELQQMFC